MCKKNLHTIFLLFIFFVPAIAQINELIIAETGSELDENIHDNCADTEINYRKKHHCCCRGPRGPQGPQGEQGPPGPSASFEYAYIYSTANSVISPGSSIPFEHNGIMSSNIVHSTTSNTDQIIVNRTGDYRIIYNLTSTGAMYFAISINGVIQTTSLYGTNTGGTILAGSTIVSLNSGDIVRITNYSIATTTTLSNTSAGNQRISASITFRQSK